MSVSTASWHKPWRAASAVQWAGWRAPAPALGRPHQTSCCRCSTGARDMAVPQDCADRFAKWPAFLPRAGTFDAELDARRSNVAAQRRRLQLAEMSYHSGSSDYLGVLSARTDLYNAEIALIAVQQQRLVAIAGLYRALGGGWIERSGDSPPPADVGADIPLAQMQEHPRTPE